MNNLKELQEKLDRLLQRMDEHYEALMNEQKQIPKEQITKDSTCA